MKARELVCVYCGHSARIDGSHADPARDGHRAGVYLERIGRYDKDRTEPFRGAFGNANSPGRPQGVSWKRRVHAG